MWEPKIARSATLQVCAMLLRRPDNVETEVTVLASAVLFNPTAFQSEAEFRNFLKLVLVWSDEHVDSLIAQMTIPNEEST